MNLATVILAAGQGKRMKSSKPKVLHPILGKPMLWYIIQVANQVTQRKTIVVVGHKPDLIKETFKESALFVPQEEQLGTGHAVLQTEPLLKGKVDFVLVTYGDMPLLRERTLRKLIDSKPNPLQPITMLTVFMDDPHGFGRIIRDDNGDVHAIVEEAQATQKQREIKELNAGVYVFNAEWLWDALPKITLSPKGEYYLTDLIGIAIEQGKSIKAIPVEDTQEVIGVNTRVHLAEVSSIIQARINRKWMLDGVTITNPDSTTIEPTVSIGQDTTILPNTFLQGDTRIGENCVIGPNSIVDNTKIGRNCIIRASVLEGAILEDNVDIGPFGHLRRGAHLAKGVHMGNFGEVKDSHLGEGTKMGHFSYIGNATIGKNVNIGAGTITCNYDGKQKNPTEIGDDVFIGSDTMLVAPIKLGDGAHTGAGSVVTKDIAEYMLAVGIPARAIRKINREEKASVKNEKKDG
ncbi:MAG: bifunctional UDP-N-acetylglucosamine diphosphorylase/glucosamine-1-phosphate N-acetyltransferase GlmU [Anaerolineales bacterium]|nr:bifunctional UDP-N-acetylglucosamine diphosphorylase/glucosamine-1-phosphate N-acetyltransferase GlmU [Anaerolineales bacterium]